MYSAVQSLERAVVIVIIVMTIVVVIEIAVQGLKARASCELGRHMAPTLYSQPQAVTPCIFFVCSIQMSLSLRTTDF